MGVRRTARLRALACIALAGTISAAFADRAAADCRGLAGQYLFDVKNAALSGALKTALAKSFKRFDDRYQVQVPFEQTGDGYVYAPACMAHSCSVEEAFLGIEESSCKIFAALLEDGKYTLVIPDSDWPASLEKARQDWMNR